MVAQRQQIVQVPEAVAVQVTQALVAQNPVQPAPAQESVTSQMLVPAASMTTSHYAFGRFKREWEIRLGHEIIYNVYPWP